MTTAPGPVTFASRDDEDAYWMGLAIAEAQVAAAKGEVPVGAVLTCSGAAVARAHNVMVGAHDATQHAEMRVLKAGAYAMGDARLVQSTLYVTLEPCAMCAGAILHARISRLVYGARDPKTGACGSVVDLFGDARLNHHATAEGGVLADECGKLLSDFFGRLRRPAL